MSSARTGKSDQSLLTPARIAISIVVLSLVATFGVSSCNSGEVTSNSSPVTSQPNPATRGAQPAAPSLILPANVLSSQLRGSDGKTIKLGDYSGKILLLNIWATWCGPCRNEIPVLVSLYSEFKPQGLEIVGLSTENADASADKVREFIQAFNINYRVGWINSEVAVPLMQGRDNIPQSFLISRDGKILKRFIGFSPVSTPPQLRQAIQDALKG